MSDRSPPEIQYERDEAGPGITRRQGRWLVLLMLINTVLLGTNVVGPQMWPAVQATWKDWQAKRAAEKAAQAAAVAEKQQEQAVLSLQAAQLEFTMPPGRVIFESDPDRARDAILSGRGFLPVSNNIEQRRQWRWQPPVHAPTTGPSGPNRFLDNDAGKAVLFVHGRTVPGGTTEKLVVAIIEPRIEFISVGTPRSLAESLSPNFQLSVFAFTPAKAGDRPVEKNGLKTWRSHIVQVKVPPAAIRHLDSTSETPPKLTLEPGLALQMLAGEVDPEDKSHFTLPYRLGDEPGVIDVWLRSDAIEIIPNGADPGPNATWTLPANVWPATRPMRPDESP